MPRDCALGIDIGKEGYAALLAPDGDLIATLPAPLLTSDDYDAARMLDNMQAWAPRVGLCAIEEPITVRDQDPATSLVVGRGHGLWLMALVAAGVPHERVAPSVWKQAMGCWVVAPKTPRGQGLKARTGLGRDELMKAVGTLRRRIKEGYAPTPEEQALIDANKASASNSAAKKKAAKEASIARAHALFPGFDFRDNDRCKVPHDGKVEAALLAAYALRRMRGQG